MPGPPKNPDAIRRNLPAGPEAVLPAGGREGPVPSWPLSDPSEVEVEVWSQVWGTPQAVAWERLGWIRTVARYVRLCTLAELPDAQVTLAGEVRQLEDRLGLTPMSLKRLQWVISDSVDESAPVVDDELSQKRADRRARVVG